MKLILNLSILLSVIVFFSCSTNPPTGPVIPDTGKIFVSSNITGAKIYLDNVNTGKVTPDTLEATVGLHTVMIEKQDYTTASSIVTVKKDLTVPANLTIEMVQAPKIVLIEDFANVSCVPCVASNKILHSLNSYTYGPTKIITIKFPTNFPGPNDPFYLVNKPNSDARKTFYTVNSAPTIVVDGISKPVPSDSTKIKEAINQRLALAAKFSIVLKDSISGSNVFITAAVKPLNISGLDFSNLVIHMVLAEDVVSFLTPPGSNGETVFYDVIRAMSPNASGQQLTAGNSSAQTNYSGSFSLAGYIHGNMKVVVFIQDKSTKEVFQVAAKNLE